MVDPGLLREKPDGFYTYVPTELQPVSMWWRINGRESWQSFLEKDASRTRICNDSNYWWTKPLRLRKHVLSTWWRLWWDPIFHANQLVTRMLPINSSFNHYSFYYTNHTEASKLREVDLGCRKNTGCIDMHWLSCIFQTVQDSRFHLKIHLSCADQNLEVTFGRNRFWMDVRYLATNTGCSSDQTKTLEI